MQTLEAATDLAALGHYADALALLEMAPPSGPRLAVLSLRAKIAAQLGRYDEAIVAWREVLAIAPEDEGARRGIASAEVCRRRGQSAGYRRRMVWLAAGILAIAGLAGSAAVMVVVVAGWAVGPIQETLVVVERRQYQQAQQLARIEANFVDSVAGPTPMGATRSFAPLAAAVPGVKYRSEGNEQVLLFDDGLFANGSVEPAAEVMPTLDAVAGGLLPLAGQVAVTVEGRTDDVPWRGAGGSRDNFAIGMVRAAAVAGILHGKGGVPAEVLSIQSLGDRAPLYPNDTAANRARNRTVVIRLSRVDRE